MSDSQPITSRICLGTAQIGLNYGAANVSGRPSDAACDRLLSRSIELGLLRWDTAPVYGDAETRIGSFLRRCRRRDEVRVISKLSSPPEDLRETELLRWLASEIDTSLRALGIERLEAWLVHEPELLSRYGDALWDAMSAQVDRGVVRRIGASVYNVEEVHQALCQSDCGAVQISLNLLDSRFPQSGVLDQCQRRDLAVYARSALLQGVLTMRPDELPTGLTHLKRPLEQLRNVLEQFGVQPLDVALPHVLSHAQVDYVVIGVDGVSQLEDNLSRAAMPMPAELASQLRRVFSDLTAQQLEPRKWPQTQ